MFDETKLSEKLNKEKEILGGLQKKKDSLDAKMKAVISNIQRYQTALDKMKFEHYHQVLNGTGVSLDDLIDAVQAGNTDQLANLFKQA